MPIPPAPRAFKRFSGFATIGAALLLGSAGCLQGSNPVDQSGEVSPSSDEIVPSSEFEQRLAGAIAGPDLGLDSDDGARPAPQSLSHEATEVGVLGRCLRTIDGPMEITEPGVYRVTRDFSVSEAEGDAIVIHANFVWLDLAGHTITGPGNKIGRGVVADDARFVLIANGRLETFGIGVALLDTDRSAVAFVEVQGGDEMAAPPAIPPQIGILLVNSARNSIRWNEVNDTNLGFFVRGGDSFENHIRGNEAVAGDHGLLAICYNPAEGEGPEGPSHDVVRRNLLSRFGTGIQTSAGSAYNLFARNRIEYFVSPWVDFNGTNEFVDNTTIQLLP